MICGIYKLTSPSNKCYIGQSTNITQRFDYYKKKRCKEQPAIYNALNKYGPEHFKYEIIEQCENDIDILDKLEKHYIEKYDSIKTGYNCNDGGRVHNFSDATRKKLSDSIKASFAEGRRSHKGDKNNFFGKHHSQKTKNLIRNKLTGSILSSETKQKISEKHKGRKFSKEHSENKSLSQIGSKNPIAKAVIINNVIYSTITEAAKNLNIKVSTMHFRINAKSFKDYQYYTAISATNLE